MARQFKVTVEFPGVNGVEVEYFEVDDDATDKEIEEEARDIFQNICSYGYHEVTGEDING